MAVSHTHVTKYWVGLLERGAISIPGLRKLFDGCDWCKKKLNSLVERKRKFKDRKERRLRGPISKMEFDERRALRRRLRKQKPSKLLV